MKEIIVRIRRCPDERIPADWKDEGIKEAFSVAWGENKSFIVIPTASLDDLVKKIRESEGEL